MTVTANTTRNDYTAGSAQSVYNYTFQLNEAADVDVYLDGVKQTLNTHYTVQNVGNASGGTITFTLVDANNNPIHPTQGAVINIVMAMDLDRDTNYQPSGAFLAADVNNDFDRLWLATNQQQTAVNRSLRLQDDDVTTSSMELPLKDARKGKLLAFNATTGDPEATSNNQSNWDSAYNDIITSASFSGGNYTLTQRDGGTITTSLDGRYLKLSGGNVTGTTRFIEGLLVDQNKAIAFNGSQLVMGTSGTESFIIEGGAGDLSIDAANLNLRASPTVNYITATNGGAVSLYHNNSVKLATTSGGISVTGTITATGYNDTNWNTAYNDKINAVSFSSANNTLTLTQQDGTTLTTVINGSLTGGGETLAQTLAIGNTTGGNDISFDDNDKAKFGASDDLQIYHNGTNSIIDNTGSGSLIIQDTDGTGDILIRPKSGQTAIAAYNDNTVELGYAGNVKLATTATGINVTGGMNTTGNVGIGTSSPAQPLHIDLNGTSTAYQYLQLDGDGSGGSTSGQAGIGFRPIGAGNNIHASINALEDGNATYKTELTFNVNTSNSDTAPTEAMRIDSDGKVGIGTTSPRNQLTVGNTTDSADDQNATVGIKCDANHQGIMLQENSGAEQWSMGVNADGDLNFYDSQVTTPTVTFKDNGGVGIGTDSPARKLTVQGGVGDNLPARIIGGSDTTKSHIEFQDASTTADYKVTLGSVGDGMSFQAGGSERMRIDSSGNVGIGTTSPATALDVSGDITLSGVVNAGDGSASAPSYTFGDDTNTGMFSPAADTIALSEGGVERMRITSSGNVGIGTTSPSQRLHVNGAVQGNRFIATSNNNSIALAGLYGGIGLTIKHVYSSSSTSYATMISFTNNSNGEAGRIRTNGSSTQYVTTSDERLKENIQDAGDAGAKIDAIQIRQFDWKGSGEHEDFGVIAQELQSVAPEAVSEGETADDMMGVDYSKLVPTLIKEIQSLRNRVAELENN